MYNKKFPINNIVTSKSKTGQQYIPQSSCRNMCNNTSSVPPFQNINSKLFTSLQEKLIRVKLGLSNKNFN